MHTTVPYGHAARRRAPRWRLRALAQTVRSAAGALVMTMGHVGGLAAQASGPPSNAVYLEALGNAAVYSVNYERTLFGTWYLRIGAGYLALPETDSDEVDGLGMIPLMAGYVTPTAPHGVELSLGLAPVLTRGNWADAGILSSETRIVGTATIGYRYAPQRSRVLLRAGFTPLFGTGGFSPWGGASVGFRF